MGLWEKYILVLGDGRGEAIFGKEEESPTSMVPQKKDANILEQIRIFGW